MYALNERIRYDGHSFICVDAKASEWPSDVVQFMLLDEVGVNMMIPVKNMQKLRRECTF